MVAKARQFQALNDANQRSGIATALARAARLSVGDMKAVPAVGGALPEMRDSSYGVINDLPPLDTLNATANATNATAPAKSAAGGARVSVVAAAVLGAAALLVL